MNESFNRICRVFSQAGCNEWCGTVGFRDAVNTPRVGVELRALTTTCSTRVLLVLHTIAGCVLASSRFLSLRSVLHENTDSTMNCAKFGEECE